ncbi:MAG: FHA domain-containing protein [Chloroflexota bacterium]|nr:FHA domain-containing protein [Chloroflexota bacterium]
MPNFETLPFDIFILALRIAFIGLIYLFLWQVVRVITRDLRQAIAVDATQQKPKYGRLVVIEPGQSRMSAGTIFTLQAVTSLGRKPSSTIVLDDDFVSGEHTLISWRDGRPWLEDAGSTNGTFLNDSEITRPVALSEGDIVGVGGARLKWTEA